MTAFTNPSDLFSNLLQLAQKYPDCTIDVASYSMYLAIDKNGTDWQNVYPSAARAFMEEVVKHKHRVIIGLHYMVECKPNCMDCIHSYNQVLMRHRVTAHRLGINIKYSDNVHLKYYRIGNSYFSGGINLAMSKSVDVSFAVPEVTGIAMADVFDDAWDKANANIKVFLK